MIRHGYTACATCHSDPSGSGLLTEYGRAQSDLLLRMHYSSNSDDVAPTSAFAWGLVKPPHWLLAGVKVRTLAIIQKNGDAKATTSFLLMQADAQAEARFAGGFRVNASAGIVPTDYSGASIAGAFVSREHWLGYGTGDDSILVRAGRINVPLGLRILEHPMYVRSATHVDLNDTQQDGVTFAYTGTWLRAEAMGILGDYQIRPDRYRDRGYSGTAEISASSRLGLGVSSAVTHAATDLFLKVSATRQKHGLFARWSPWEPLVLMA